MKEITIGQLRREGSESKIRKWIPCQVLSDGVPVALLIACETSPVKQDAAHKNSETTLSPKVAHHMGRSLSKHDQAERSRKHH